MKSLVYTDKILVAKDALGQQEVQITKIQLNVDNLLGNIVTAENPANVLNLLSSLSEDEYNKFLNYLSQIGMTMASASGALYAAFMAFRRKEEDSTEGDLVNHETHENHERDLGVDNAGDGELALDVDNVGLEDDFVDGLEGTFEDEEVSDEDFGSEDADGKTQSDGGDSKILRAVGGNQDDLDAWTKPTLDDTNNTQKNNVEKDTAKIKIQKNIF